jgi:hypothetical protein
MEVFVSQDMCYVKDVQIPPSFIREVLPSDKFCLNYLMGQPPFINFTLYFRLKPKSKKSDAPVGRVNTFIILHTKEFKIAFKIRNL